MFKDLLLENYNITKTENGALTLKSSTNELLDFYFKATRLSDRFNEKAFISLLINAYKTSPLETLVILFNLRDIRGGKGERDLFRIAMKWVKSYDLTNYNKVVSLIPEYGRYDDLLVLEEYKILANTLTNDAKALSTDKGSVSLCAKWMPTHTSNKFKKERLALQEVLGVNEKQYRIGLTRLRKHLDIVERKLSTKEYSSIEYSKLPSKAMQKYRTTFFKKDLERVTAYIEALEKGGAKVNTATLFPHELCIKPTRIAEETRLLKQQWTSYKKQYKDTKLSSVLVASDISGSMGGKPMEISIGLGIFLSQLQATESFKDILCLFSEHGSFVSTKGDDPSKIYTGILKRSCNSHCSTNVMSVFQGILKIAKKDNLSQKDMPECVIIISDMQFNSFGSKTTHKEIKSLYKDNGYKTPKLIYWNVSSSQGIPVVNNEENTIMVSGNSPSIIKQILNIESFSPDYIIKEIINSERYKPVLEALK